MYLSRMYAGQVPIYTSLLRKVLSMTRNLAYKTRGVVSLFKFGIEK